MTKIEIIAQLMAIVVSLSMGRHDGTAIKVFHEKGWAGKKENWWFHQTNNLTKALFVVLLSTMAAPDLRIMAFVAAVCICWIYMLFDMATGKWGHANSYFYLGHNDDNGNVWRTLFGDDAGKLKVIVLSAIIVGLHAYRIIFL